MLYNNKLVTSTFAFPVSFANGEVIFASPTPWKIGDELPHYKQSLYYLVNAKVAADNLDREDFVQLDPRHPDIIRDEGGRVLKQGGVCHATDLLPKE